MGESGSRCEVCLRVWIPTCYTVEKVWLHPSTRGNSAKLRGGIRVVGCHGRWSSKNLIIQRISRKGMQLNCFEKRMYIFKLIGDFDGLYFNYWTVINKFLKNKSGLCHLYRCIFFYVLKIHSTEVCSFNISYRCNPLYAFMTGFFHVFVDRLFVFLLQ